MDKPTIIDFLKTIDEIEVRGRLDVTLVYRLFGFIQEKIKKKEDYFSEKEIQDVEDILSEIRVKGQLNIISMKKAYDFLKISYDEISESKKTEKKEGGEK